MNLFDRTEIQSAIATINDEKTKLEALYQELWDIFGRIDRTKPVRISGERLRDSQRLPEAVFAFAKMV